MGRHRGFTLIEIAVVVLIITIVLGIVGVNLIPDRDAALRDEAKRLALLLQSAQQESILQDKIIVVAIDRQGYHFLVLDDASELTPLSHDDAFYPRKLPQDITISSVDIDGAPVLEKPRLIMLPTGELPDFSVIFSRGETRWEVKGLLSGNITAQAAPAPGKA